MRLFLFGVEVIQFQQILEVRPCLQTPARDQEYAGAGSRLERTDRHHTVPQEGERRPGHQDRAPARRMGLFSLCLQILDERMDLGREGCPCGKDSAVLAGLRQQHGACHGNSVALGFQFIDPVEQRREAGGCRAD